VPLLVGGAALSPSFTRDRIAPAYAAPVRYAGDAMAGLAIANQLMAAGAEKPGSGVRGPGSGKDDMEQLAVMADGRPPSSRQTAGTSSAVTGNGQRAADNGQRATGVALPRPPDLARHVLPHLPLDEVFAHLNPQMLYGKHLGVRGSVRRLLDAGDLRAEELQRRVQALQDAAVSRGWLAAAAVYRFFRAVGRGDAVELLDPAGVELATLPYRRQAKPPHACAADWVDRRPEAGDAVAMFVVTAGGGVRERAAALREDGRLLDSVALQALAIETAEAAAEWLHRRLRELWGFADPPEMTMEERFRARYRGIRLSFGYPACPELEPQADVFRLLAPAGIGVSLTEGYMMDPEASISAVVFHHPDARYLG
jgi:5-methyltetrahydrofolate--homocysteine methyltransferase